MDNVLEQVKAFATKAHGEQRRKFADEPYIAHPIRVMEICAAHTKDVAVLAAALLHDVLEDTAVKKDELQVFLNGVMDSTKAQRTLLLVDELTDRYVKANYPQWNRRKRKSKETERLEKTSAESQTIKYADIIDNSAEIAHQETDDFAIVFLKECQALLKRLDKGNPVLHQRALDTVQEGLAYLQRN
jgi:guanosine-3',5'-bis(diphosphate) 3'-pyrophosphohydrolase